MDWWLDLQLNQSGLPQLLENEIQVHSQHEVDIYINDDKLFRRGRAILTTHRLIWMKEGERAIFGHLSRIRRVDHEVGFVRRSAKLILTVTAAKGAGTSIVKLSFKEKGSREFQEPLMTALSRQAWIDTGPSQFADKRVQEREFSTASAGVNLFGGHHGQKSKKDVLGIAGILERKKRDMEEEKKFTEASMNDLQALMKNAKDMVELMNRYSQGNMKTKSNASDEDSEKFETFLMDLGIKSPVTRETAGIMYHKDLAKQLSGFIVRRLEARGIGMMTLTDVYCLYNRARGLSLISPDDLLEAAKLLNKLQLGMRLHTFESGVRVIQLDSYSEESIAGKILEVVKKTKTGYVSAADVASHFRISITLGTEYLLLAEKQGKLCRDDSLEGLFFHENKFPTFSFTFVAQPRKAA